MIWSLPSQRKLSIQAVVIGLEMSSRSCIIFVHSVFNGIDCLIFTCHWVWIYLFNGIIERFLPSRARRRCMLWLITFSLFYSMILFSVSSIFSFSNPYILLSDNFECGFYPILLFSLLYRINYWILTIYFLIFEQELILVLLLTFCMKTFNENIILCYLLGLLFLDLQFIHLF